MTRMYDSINPGAIPRDAPIVAGYGDGKYQWRPTDWALFPNAVHLSIVCFAGSAGDILDVEQGCSAPSEVAGWVDRYQRPRFTVPTIYVNRANWPAVRQAVGSRQVDWWVATLDGTVSVPGAAAVQFVDTGSYDVSETEPWWPRGLAPGPAPSPVTQEESPVVIFGIAPATDGTNVGYWLLSGSLYVHVPDNETFTALSNAGVKVVPNVSYAQHQALLAGSAALQGQLTGSLSVSGNMRVGP